MFQMLGLKYEDMMTLVLESVFSRDLWWVAKQTSEQKVIKWINYFIQS
jgi:hypothetical protein